MFGTSLRQVCDIFCDRFTTFETKPATHTPLHTIGYQGLTLERNIGDGACEIGGKLGTEEIGDGGNQPAAIHDPEGVSGVYP